MKELLGVLLTLHRHLHTIGRVPAVIDDVPPTVAAALAGITVSVGMVGEAMVVV